MNWEFGAIVKAEPFVLVHNGTYLEFELLLFPNGANNVYSKTDSKGVLVGLRSLNQGRNLYVRDKISIFLSNGSSHMVDGWSQEVEYEGIHSRFCLKPVARNLAELKNKSLLVDIHLCVAVELKISQSHFHIGDQIEKNVSSKDYEDIGFCSKLYAKRGGVHDSSDYEIVCQGTNIRFQIHKVVARERSPYFEDLFSSHPNFGRESFHNVEPIILFIYFDISPFWMDDFLWEELVDVANMLQLKKLVAIYEKKLIAQITEKNAWDYLGMADTYGMKFLKNRALCVATEDPEVAEKLVDENGKKMELRKEVVDFLVKRGRAQLLVQWANSGGERMMFCLGEGMRGFDV